MNAKFLVVGAIVGGVVLFLWGAVTHAVLPQQLHEFKDEQAIAQVIRTNIATNGVYLSRQGVFASVAFRPDFGDKTHNILPNLLTQLVTDTLGALLLCLVLAGIRADSVIGRAGWLTLAGLAVVALKLLPYWNWYGFSPGFIAMEALDVVGKFFIGGLVLGALANKMVAAQPR